MVASNSDSQENQPEVFIAHMSTCGEDGAGLLNVVDATDPKMTKSLVGLNRGADKLIVTTTVSESEVQLRINCYLNDIHRGQ